MSRVEVRIRSRRFLETRRRDLWWVQPALVVLGLVAFIVYTTWASLQNANYHWQGYLSPFYSPEVFGESEHAWFPKPANWPSWLPFTPAYFILWAPALFRFTCYYWRGVYYKAFWADPVNCAVGEPRKGYRGEAKLPLILQNVHRYFMYVAVLFLPLLAWDVYKGMWFTVQQADGSTVKEFGVGVGTVVLALDVLFLSFYVFGCHSLRHLIGGRRDCVSKGFAGGLPYKCVSCLNGRHGFWGWVSLGWVAFADIYVRLVASGVWTDYRVVFFTTSAGGA